jgi:hypothetical protein
MFPPSFIAVGTDMAGAPMPFTDPSLGPSPDHPPENVDWHSMYQGELERLKNMTKEQDKAEAPQEWYRMMTMRLRMGMMGLPLFALGPGESLSQAGTHSAQHEAMGGDSGIMEEEEED